jgi:hypothetical protein
MREATIFSPSLLEFFLVIVIFFYLINWITTIKESKQIIISSMKKQKMVSC